MLFCTSLFDARSCFVMLLPVVFNLYSTLFLGVLMPVIRTLFRVLLRPNCLVRKMSSTPEQCTIAVVQMCSTDNVNDNYNICERLVKRAVTDMNAKVCVILFFSNCFSF
jgi:hypothetical protein